MDDPACDPATPNLLLICCDQLRSDWLRVHGHPLIQTPHLDQLAHRGLDFRRAWTPCPTCVPARRCLLTGRDAYGVHMNTNRGRQPFPEGPKLAELVTRAGWQTCAVGKMHTFPMRNRQGFEEVWFAEDGRLDEQGRPDDYHRYLTDRGLAHLAFSHGAGGNQYGARLSPLPERHTGTHWTADRAMDFLERRDPTRPFCLYVSFEQPHPPFVPPAEFWELYRDLEFPAPERGDWVDAKTPAIHRELQGRSNLFDWLDQEHVIQQNLRGYAAMITHIDAMIGCLTGQLRDLGLLDNTHVVFTADHGEALFDHEAVAKGTPFHGPANVPLIVAPSRHLIRATCRPELLGRADLHAPAGLIDILPTVCDLLGIATPDGIDGSSLTPFLREASPAFRRWTCTRYACCYGITDGRWRYQWHADESDVELLFDVDADPRECHDLADDRGHAEIKAEARTALLAWMTAHDDEHVVEGRPTPLPFDWVDAYTHTKDSYTNRGRR